MQDYLTLAEAAKEVGLSPTTLRAYTNGKLDPLLPSETIGRAKVVTRKQFEAWRLARQGRKDGTK